MSRIVAGKSDPLIAGQRLFSGRSAVAPVDLILLKDCLWYDAQSLNLIQQQIDVLMTGHARQQQGMLTRLARLCNVTCNFSSNKAIKQP